jgi:hypothetical protein
MFVAGLFAGPFLGLLAGYLTVREGFATAVWVAIAIFYLLLVAVAAIDQELRVGLGMGMALGLLVARSSSQVNTT